MSSLLIDGYNLLHVLDQSPLQTWEKKRSDFLERLHRYQAQKHVDMTVVFDSSEVGSLVPRRDKWGEIEIIYTEKGLSADEWIASACRENPGRYIVVSNDREVISNAQFHRCVSLSSDEFARKISAATRVLDEIVDTEGYTEDKDEDFPLYPKVSTKKKGVAKRLPKRERQKFGLLKNL